MELPILKPDGTSLLLTLRVKPRGRLNGIEGVREGLLLLSVTAAPTDGEANAAVIATLAKALHISKSSVELVRGHKSREKTVRIGGLGVEELKVRLQTLL